MSQTPAELLAAYKKSGQEFAEIAATIPADQMNKPMPGGEWPPAFVIHHMADAELHFATRYLHILTTDKPTIINFNEEAYADRTHYAKRSAAESLALCISIHNVVLSILGNASETDWERTGVHFELGEIPMKQFFAKAVGHNAEHAQQLRDLIN
jgi:hypothetical protein